MHCDGILFMVGLLLLIVLRCVPAASLAIVLVPLVCVACLVVFFFWSSLSQVSGLVLRKRAYEQATVETTASDVPIRVATIVEMCTIGIEVGSVTIRRRHSTPATSLRVFLFFSSRRRHTRLQGDWSSDVCSS